jgi:hypothetical protein
MSDTAKGFYSYKKLKKYAKKKNKELLVTDFLQQKATWTHMDGSKFEVHYIHSEKFILNYMGMSDDEQEPGSILWAEHHGPFILMESDLKVKLTIESLPKKY